MISERGRKYRCPKFPGVQVVVETTAPPDVKLFVWIHVIIIASTHVEIGV
jgi:hypothetical protein